MPFTFSHPAVVLPLFGKKTKLSTSGLLIGSMVPDFEKFIRMGLKGDFSESFLGILLFDLPLSLLLLFIFHLLIRDKFIVFLPNALYQRFGNYIGFNWLGYFKKNWHLVVSSILLGIATHLLWDSFTHYDGFIALYFYDVFYFKIFGISLFNVLQFISSVVGLIIVGRYIYKMDRNKSLLDSRYKKNRYWPLVFLICSFTFVIRWYFGFERYEEVLITIIAAFMWALILGSIFARKPKSI